MSKINNFCTPVKISTAAGSVSDPDSFFTDPDPGFFPNPDQDSGSRQQKANFSKAKTKF